MDTGLELIGYISIKFIISQLYVTLMNDFDKTFVLAFYKSFLKKEWNCDEENMLILNTCSFQKKMHNLLCVFIYSFKDNCVLKIL